MVVLVGISTEDATGSIQVLIVSQNCPNWKGTPTGVFCDCDRVQDSFRVDVADAQYVQRECLIYAEEGGKVPRICDSTLGCAFACLLV